ncbi:subtilisin-like protein [Pholiota conissans]|uniref:tripeptidyl-peptidase II n=1 Tax=Pholiota conissans TaxID=109636 RepID=A0A9P6CUB5_9AGAR|nr:subtilisin-like protein [Pholiota conissans]
MILRDYIVYCSGGKHRFAKLVLHDIRSAIPAGFTTSSPAKSTDILTLRIALTENDISGLNTSLYSVSTPGSASYGKYLSKTEVDAYISPSANSTRMVNKWLSLNNLTATNLTAAGDWLQVSMPVTQANTLLAANFTVFNHSTAGIQLTRTLSYSIPAVLKNYIQLIHPTTSFAIANRLSAVVKTPTALKNSVEVIPRQSSSDSICETSVTPQCLQELYGIPSNDNSSASGNTLGISGFLNQFANQEDLTVFLAAFRPDMNPSTNFSLLEVDGGTNSQDQTEAGVEASLDIQYTVGLVSTISVTFISVGESNNDGGLDGFQDMINFLIDSDDADLPGIVTTSYGFDEDAISQDLAVKLCNSYMALGARGVTLLFSSGDGGVSGSQEQDGCTTFVPTFPSGCPYITSVGGTAGFSNETAASFSSGGFSNIFPRPSYQDDAVTQYLNILGDINTGLFNASGRAYPDVSAQSVGLQVVVDNATESVDGTSCSSPIFASVIASLNDLLIGQGQPRLGFLNPLIYGGTLSAALSDITTGNNAGCGTNGFPAVSGWDPVTGLGTPNFASLQAALGI